MPVKKKALPSPADAPDPWHGVGGAYRIDPDTGRRLPDIEPHFEQPPSDADDGDAQPE
ncbi:MAG: hypothetical protein ACT4QA_17595 [Panacagrimonas sp.]